MTTQITSCARCGAQYDAPYPVIPADSTLCETCGEDAKTLMGMLDGRTDVPALYAAHGTDEAVLAYLKSRR